MTVLLSSLAAAENAPWPEVLSLDFALSQADSTHPDLRLANAAIASAQAGRLAANSRYGLESSIEGRLRWVDPPGIAYDQGRDDHRLSLLVSKPLYDFGRTAAYQQAAEAAVSGQEYLLQDAFNQHRIAIMAAYFDVLLADLAKSRNEEAMSGAFIRADRTADRNELGQVSDINLYQVRSDYQQVRENWYRSRSLQRTTRTHLANVLNRPEDIPSELTTPRLLDNNRDVPTEVNDWLVLAERQNPLLLASQAKVSSARESLAAVMANKNPMLRGELEASEYSKESGSNDNWRAGLTISIPISTGGRSSAERAMRRAELETAKARLEQQRREIRQALVEQWGELQALKVSQDRALALIDYRDLYLDRSRTLYEQEVKSDLGDAMTKTSEARLESMRVEFSLALAWARVDALLGRTVYAAGRIDADVEKENNL